MEDKFKTGAVLVHFKKDLPYMDTKGKAIEVLKGKPQFEKGKRAMLKYSDAGKLHKAGYLEILDENKNVVDVQTVAKQK